MELNVEAGVTCANVMVQLASVHWRELEPTPHYDGYALSQRLSDNHPPLRIDNLRGSDVFPRVRSIGCLPPGRTVDLFPIGPPLRVLYCVFDESYFERETGVPRSDWEDRLASLVSIKNRRIELLMQEIHAELLQPGFGTELLIEATSNMIVVELARHVRQLPPAGARGSVGLALASWQMRRIQERVQASLELGYPNLAELAEICGISQGHLARTFKASSGWQIHQYIADQRLQAAKSLLAESDMSCEEISATLGFKSAAYFSTSFRRMAGKTPSEFRNEARSKASASS